MGIKIWDDERVTDYDLNNNFGSNNILTLDATTDLNVTRSWAGGTGDPTGSTTDTKDYSFTSSDLKNADYLIIEVCGVWRGTSSASSQDIGPAQAGLVIAVTAPTPATLYSNTALVSSDARDEDSQDTDSTTFFRWIHTLTAGEKSSGLTIRLTTNATITTAASLGSISASFTNAQICFRLGY